MAILAIDSNQIKFMIFQSQSKDVLIEIFNKLPLPSLLTSRRLCKQIKLLIDQNFLGKIIHLSTSIFISFKEMDQIFPLSVRSESTCFKAPQAFIYQKILGRYGKQLYEIGKLKRAKEVFFKLFLLEQFTVYSFHRLCKTNDSGFKSFLRAVFEIPFEFEKNKLIENNRFEFSSFKAYLLAYVRFKMNESLFLYSIGETPLVPNPSLKDFIKRPHLEFPLYDFVDTYFFAPTIAEIDSYHKAAFIEKLLNEAAADLSRENFANLLTFYPVYIKICSLKETSKSHYFSTEKLLRQKNVYTGYFALIEKMFIAKEWKKCCRLFELYLVSLGEHDDLEVIQNFLQAVKIHMQSNFECINPEFVSHELLKQSIINFNSQILLIHSMKVIERRADLFTWWETNQLKLSQMDLILKEWILFIMVSKLPSENNKFEKELKNYFTDFFLSTYSLRLGEVPYVNSLLNILNHLAKAGHIHMISELLERMDFNQLMSTDFKMLGYGDIDLKKISLLVKTMSDTASNSVEKERVIHKLKTAFSFIENKKLIEESICFGRLYHIVNMKMMVDFSELKLKIKDIYNKYYLQSGVQMMLPGGRVDYLQGSIAPVLPDYNLYRLALQCLTALVQFKKS